MSKIVSQFKLNYDAKHDAFPYQREAFESVKDLDYAAIFHEQGLGKTKIAIDLMLYWLQKKDIDTVLIVSKKQLIKNWMDEIQEHTHIRAKTLSSNKADNFYVLNSPTKVIVTNFETLSTDKQRMKLFLKARNVAIIIDESTKIKNPESKLTQDYFELSSLFKIKVIMTGTPVANRPYDIWAQIYFLDEGESLGTDYSQFKKHTNLTNTLASDRNEQKIFKDNVSVIFEKISGFSVRETKKSCAIELPSKNYETVYADFEKRQQEMYSQVLRELEIMVEKDEKVRVDDNSVVLKRLSRLLQIASNPRIIDDGYEGISGKEEVLDRLINEIVSRGEKCIVWSNFIENVDWLTNKYTNYRARKLHGSMSIEERNKSVDVFKKDEDCKLLFATPQAAKEGLTLTVANNVIFYDRGFNLDDYLQAQDRIHRISQKKSCNIYNIMIENSVDEWIAALLEAKQSAAFLAQGDITESEFEKQMDYSYGNMIAEILNAAEEYYGY